MNNDNIMAGEFTSQWENVPEFLAIPVGSTFRYKHGTDLWERVSKCHVRHLRSGTTFTGFPHPAAVVVVLGDEAPAPSPYGKREFTFPERTVPAPGHALGDMFPLADDGGWNS